MIPDFRFNKKITKMLIKSSVPKEQRLVKTSLDWRLDNQKGLYGSIYQNIWGDKRTFLLQKLTDGLYRLVMVGVNQEIHIYSIGNIDLYLDIIGVDEIIASSFENISEQAVKAEIMNVLEAAKTFPNTGIIEIENERVYVYDFTNNE